MTAFVLMGTNIAVADDFGYTTATANSTWLTATTATGDTISFVGANSNQGKKLFVGGSNVTVVKRPGLLYLVAPTDNGDAAVNHAVSWRVIRYRLVSSTFKRDLVDETVKWYRWTKSAPQQVVSDYEKLVDPRDPNHQTKTAYRTLAVPFAKKVWRLMQRGDTKALKALAAIRTIDEEVGLGPKVKINLPSLKRPAGMFDLEELQGRAVDVFTKPPYLKAVCNRHWELRHRDGPDGRWEGWVIHFELQGSRMVITRLYYNGQPDEG